jgi:hypothetical protein
LFIYHDSLQSFIRLFYQESIQHGAALGLVAVMERWKVEVSGSLAPQLFYWNACGSHLSSFRRNPMAHRPALNIHQSLMAYRYHLRQRLPIVIEHRPQTQFQPKAAIFLSYL